MRLKTDERRQAIIEVAIQVFREVGFERASMTMISRRLGGSKGTIYGYFQSKEELFEVAMRMAVEGRGDQIMGLLDPDAEDLRGMLERFGSAYLRFILSGEVLPITRTAVAEGAGSSLGAHLFELGPGRALMLFTKFFADQIERGRIRSSSPTLVSRQFKALLEAGFLEEALYGASFRSDVDAAVASSVDTFLRAFATRERRKTQVPSDAVA